MAPIPKPPGARRRRNKGPEPVTLPASSGRRRPPLPPLRQWHPETLAWWREVWHSPMASEFVPVDRYTLYRLAMLVDEFHREPDPKLAAEIRATEDRFGLSPVSRRRLAWQIGTDDPATTPTRATSPGGEDPRNLLRIVDKKEGER